MTKEELQEAMKEYLKENLSLTVCVEKHYGDYSGEGVKVTVTVDLDGEV